MKNNNLMIRVTPEEKAVWAAEAEKRGIKLSEFVRRTLNDACGVQWGFAGIQTPPDQQK